MKSSIFFIAALVPALAFSEKRISGDLNTIEFNPSYNPYVVEKDVIVPEGKSVEIPAGCVFLFNAFTGLIVNGQLRVMGTHDKPVVFTSIFDSEYNPASTQLPNPFDWNGVLVTASSQNSYFNNFHMRYSVYGIKSQSKNVIIQNGLFRQNGQFHFTIHDNIQFVQDNIPYSYGADSDAGASGKEAKAAPKKAKKETGGTIARQTRIVRFTCLGVGVAGLGAGAVITVLDIRQNRLLDEMDKDAKMRGTPGYTPKYNGSEYTDADNLRIKLNVGAVLSYSIGVLGCIGFGISFAF